MPAIITHDTFGHDVYGKLFSLIGGSRDEAEAFLLGNQGPDPLFYVVANPRLAANPQLVKLGSLMHADRPAELICALKRSIASLPKSARAIGRAYALGFLCHYELDSTAHPFIYAQQYALCDAGEPGLDRENGSDVHALIESELDELVLTAKRASTIASFNPAKRILRAQPRVLNIVSTMYVHTVRTVYDLNIPPDAFKGSVEAFRLVQALFYSPSGFKHNVVGRLEQLVRPYSFFRAMSHRNVARTSSAFDNSEHAAWQNPYADEVSHESFWDLYDRALEQALADLLAYDAPAFDEEAARAITHDRNFSGELVCAQIVAVENAQPVE